MGEQRVSEEPGDEAAGPGTLSPFSTEGTRAGLGWAGLRGAGEEVLAAGRGSRGGSTFEGVHPALLPASQLGSSAGILQTLEDFLSCSPLHHCSRSGCAGASSLLV